MSLITWQVNFVVDSSQTQESVVKWCYALYWGSVYFRNGTQRPEWYLIGWQANAVV